MKKPIVFPSLNYNDRKNGDTPRLIVLHYTSMDSTASALDRLTDDTYPTPVSAHYLIAENGDIYQLVGEEKRAWHAGESSWHGREDINSASIGIEISNRGHEPYPKEQIDSVIALCRDIMARHNIAPENVVGHSDIAAHRKQDPGEHFPWAELAQHGICKMPKPTIVDKFNAVARYRDNGKLREMFKKAGYGIGLFRDDAGMAAPSLHETVIAFQRRYEPDAFTNPKKTPGIPTVETVAKLRAVGRLNKKFRPRK